MSKTPPEDRFNISPEVKDRIDPDHIPEPWRNDIETGARKLPEECQRNQTLFWSGSPNRQFTTYSMSRSAAEVWAEWHDKKTLEMTSLGQVVDRAYENDQLSDRQKYEISKYASCIYAQNARGEVTAFVREARFDGHYDQIERPSLSKGDTQLTEMTYGSGRLEQEMRIINAKLELDMYQYHADTGRIRDDDQAITKAQEKYRQSCEDYTKAHQDLSWVEAKERLSHYRRTVDECKSYESTHSFDQKGVAERQARVKELEEELRKYPTTQHQLDRQESQKEQAQPTREHQYRWQPRSRLGQKSQQEHQQKDFPTAKDGREMER